MLPELIPRKRGALAVWGKRLLADLASGAVAFVLIHVPEFVTAIVGSAIIGGPFVWPADIRVAWPSDPTGRLNAWYGAYTLAGVASLLVATWVAWVAKTRSRLDGLRRGLLWAAMIGLYYLYQGITRGDYAMVFGILPMWFRLAAAALGPVMAGWLQERRSRTTPGRDAAGARQ